LLLIYKILSHSSISQVFFFLIPFPSRTAQEKFIASHQKFQSYQKIKSYEKMRDFRTHTYTLYRIIENSRKLHVEISARFIPAYRREKGEEGKGGAA